MACAPRHRFGPGHAGHAQPLTQPASPHGPQSVVSGQNHVFAPPGGGWLYLAMWLDRCSRKICGWDMRDIMPENLVSEALRRVLVVRRPTARIIMHSDRGS